MTNVVGPFPKLKTWFECVEERDAEIARLRAALEHYADDNYNGYNKDGAHARRALEKRLNG